MNYRYVMIIYVIFAHLFACAIHDEQLVLSPEDKEYVRNVEQAAKKLLSKVNNLPSCIAKRRYVKDHEEHLKKQLHDAQFLLEMDDSKERAYSKTTKIRFARAWQNVSRDDLRFFALKVVALQEIGKQRLKEDRIKKRADRELKKLISKKKVKKLASEKLERLSPQGMKAYKNLRSEREKR